MKKFLISIMLISAVAVFGWSCKDGKDGAIIPMAANNGAAGAAGAAGANFILDVSTLEADAQAKIAYTGTVTSVDLSGTTPVVNFKVTDASGNLLKGLGVKNAAGTQLNNMRFVIAKLVPASNGSPSRWVNYIVTSVKANQSSTTIASSACDTTYCATRPTSDREGTLVDNGDGTYKYTFNRDIKSVKATVDALTYSGNNTLADLDDLTYDASLTHRLIVEYGGNIINTSPTVAIANPMNVVYDFIPSTGAVVTSTDTQREIVTKAACNNCHGAIGKTTPHNGRADPRYCVVCHNAQRAYGQAHSTSSSGAFTGTTYVADGEILGDFPTMIHKIHKGSNIASTKLTKTGYSYTTDAAGKFDKLLGFPMSPNTCRVCHEATASAPQGDNWNTVPSRKACGACHDNVNFAAGGEYVADSAKTDHSQQADDSSCGTASCHTSEKIKSKHMTENVTTHNPTVTTGLTTFTYEIKSANIDASNNLTIEFRILADGTAVSLTGSGSTASSPPANAVISGYSGSPSFLLAYALSGTNQSFTTPADYNNLGKNAAQPISISIAALLVTGSTTGSIAASTTAGYYIATIPSTSASIIPVGAKMRAVALQGYFTQVAGTNGIAANTARHAISVQKSVTGDTARRVVVDPEKCAKCHEWFEGHGGNRVKETQVCVMCHVPNLTSSGRDISDTNIAAWWAGTSPFTAAPSTTDQANITLWGWDRTQTNAALKFPEASQNFKDLIHGIHAGKDRTQPLRFVRDRASSGVIMIFDTHEIGFPNQLKNCESCHTTKTSGTPTYSPTAIQDLTNAGTTVLPSATVVGPSATIPNGSTDVNSVAYKRQGAQLPNTDDLVSAPIAASCNSCHDSALATAHINANGIGGISTSKVLGTPSFGNYQGITTRSAYNALVTAGTPVEQCAMCHGDGKEADVAKAHKK